ncbi:MAG TPA: hypothetical protein VLX92_05390 [Kofleriaceae bacterium]|nr:hypothetical protein [Kofleriaceae bacterium]
MGRLDNIIARNRSKPRGPRLFKLGLAVFCLLLLVLALCTDLGVPKAPPQGPPRADGIYLGRPRATDGGVSTETPLRK